MKRKWLRGCHLVNTLPSVKAEHNPHHSYSSSHTASLSINGLLMDKCKYLLWGNSVCLSSVSMFCDRFHSLSLTRIEYKKKVCNVPLQLSYLPLINKHAAILNELHILSVNPFEDLRSVTIIDFLIMLY